MATTEQRERNSEQRPLIVYIDSKSKELTDASVDLCLALLPMGSELIRHDRNAVEGGTPKGRSAALDLARIISRRGHGSFSDVDRRKMGELYKTLESEA